MKSRLTATIEQNGISSAIVMELNLKPIHTHRSRSVMPLDMGHAQQCRCSQGILEAPCVRLVEEEGTYDRSNRGGGQVPYHFMIFP